MLVSYGVQITESKLNPNIQKMGTRFKRFLKVDCPTSFQTQL